MKIAILSFLVTLNSYAGFLTTDCNTIEESGEGYVFTQASLELTLSNFQKKIKVYNLGEETNFLYTKIDTDDIQGARFHIEWQDSQKKYELFLPYVPMIEVEGSKRFLGNYTIHDLETEEFITEYDVACERSIYIK